MKKTLRNRSEATFDLEPNSDNTKLIEQIDKLYYENSDFLKAFVSGNFTVVYGSAIDMGGPYNEYLRLLGENLQSIFVVEEDTRNNLRKLKFNPALNLFNNELFYAPLPTIFIIAKLLATKNVNIVSKLEFGHIVKVLIIDKLKTDDTNIDSNKHTINISHIPSYFLNMIIKYIQYCSNSQSTRQHDLTESVIKGFLQNANCFKATVYFFVKFIESGFEPNTKIDLDYISCFANPSSFAFVEDIDWNYYSSDSTVIRLIQLFSKNSFNVFQIYSMLYYNKVVKVEDFISKLVFNERFPENLKQNLISICTNYANCLDSSKPETRDLIDTIGSQESFLKLLLIYMSSFDSIIPNTSYKFNLTFSQEGWLFAHTCSKTIDIMESAKDFSLHDLTSEIILTIKRNTRFNRAG